MNRLRYLLEAIPDTIRWRHPPVHQAVCPQCKGLVLLVDLPDHTNWHRHPTTTGLRLLASERPRPPLPINNNPRARPKDAGLD